MVHDWEDSRSPLARGKSSYASFDGCINQILLRISLCEVRWIGRSGDKRENSVNSLQHLSQVGNVSVACLDPFHS